MCKFKKINLKLWYKLTKDPFEIVYTPNFGKTDAIHYKFTEDVPSKLPVHLIKRMALLSIKAPFVKNPQKLYETFVQINDEWVELK